jgi:hypothetical protein
MPLGFSDSRLKSQPPLSCILQALVTGYPGSRHEPSGTSNHLSMETMARQSERLKKSQVWVIGWTVTVEWTQEDLARALTVSTTLPNLCAEWTLVQRLSANILLNCWSAGSSFIWVRKELTSVWRPGGPTIDSSKTPCLIFFLACWGLNSGLHACWQVLGQWAASPTPSLNL